MDLLDTQMMEHLNRPVTHASLFDGGRYVSSGTAAFHQSMGGTVRRQTARTTDMTRGGSQGRPWAAYERYASPTTPASFHVGHGLEHEPVDQTERDAEWTAQAAHLTAAGILRAALRGV